jgi:thiol-disulfide isomerase/thioredoxin
LSNRAEKNGPTNRKRGLKLSKAEKIAIPVILIIAIWIVYSVTQTGPPNPGTTTSGLSSSSTQSGGAPDFSLPVVGPNGPIGKSVSLSSFRGKVVLLEFMEPWCPHCQNIAPALEQLHNKYGDRVVFISVAGPWQGATADDTASFITKYGSTWTYVYDSSGTVMNTMYGVQSTPTFFIIGKDGSVVSSCNQGESCASQLDADLAQYAG